MLVFAYLSFIVLGLPIALFGLAQPTLRPEFGISPADTGLLFIVSTIAYSSISPNTPRLMRVFGGKRALLGVTLLCGLGLLGTALTPSWGFMLLMALPIGTMGVVDAGMNAYVAKHYQAGHMSWLHAAFGLGAALGPLLMSVSFALGWGWRGGYLLAGVIYLLFAAVYAVVLKGWDDGSEQAHDAQRTTLGALPVVLVALSVMLFFIYTGIEVAAQQWVPSLLVGARGMAQEDVNLWMSVHLGAFTLGRALFGVIGNRVPPVGTLRLAGAGMVTGAALVLWNVHPLVSFVGLTLVGFALAPVFPFLMSETPARVGRQHADAVISLQVGAAGIGAAAMPALAGVLAGLYGLEMIAVFMFGTAAVMLVLHEVLLAFSRVRRTGDGG